MDHEEKEYIAQSQNVDFVIEVEEIGMKTNKWTIGNGNSTSRRAWKSTRPVSTLLASSSRAMQTRLQRSTPGSGEEEKFNLYCIKTIKGKCSGPPNLIFGVPDRRNLAFGIFDLLLQSEPTTLVMGNLGFSTNSIFTYAVEYQREKRIQLVKNLRRLTTAEQNLFCLHLKALETKYTVFISPNLASRFLFVEVTRVQDNSSNSHSADTKPELKHNSSGSHSAGTGTKRKCNSSGSQCADNEGTFKLITRHAKFLELLSTASDDESFAYVMLQPVVMSKSQRSSVDATDTIQMEGPIDIKETARMLQMGLELAREARKSVGVDASNVTLSEVQRKEAFTFLKDDIFVKKFMQKEPHRTNYLALRANNDLFHGKARQDVLQTVRGAFKTWVRALMGNTALFMVILKYGLFDSTELRKFMIAFHQIKDEGKRDMHPTDGMSPADKERLRADALLARRNYRRAINLEASLCSGALPAGADSLSVSDAKLVVEYRAGKLLQLLLEANAAYGHGLGVSRMETSEAVLSRKLSNDMEDYWR